MRIRISYYDRKGYAPLTRTCKGFIRNLISIISNNLMPIIYILQCVEYLQHTNVYLKQLGRGFTYVERDDDIYILHCRPSGGTTPA